MREKPNTSYMHQVRLYYYGFIGFSYTIRLPLMIQVLILIVDLHRGHLGQGSVPGCARARLPFQTFSKHFCDFRGPFGPTPKLSDFQPLPAPRLQAIA